MTAFEKLAYGRRSMTRQVSKLVFSVAQNGFVLIGLVVLFIGMTLAVQPGLRNAGEAELMNWLQTRHFGGAEDSPVDRATAVEPRALNREQAAVAFWLSKKYHVAPQPLSALVLQAYKIGSVTELDPLLLLSVMAIESGFNPFAQSAVGAQGLMQVMTRVHSAKYEAFGGELAAFDPLTNLRVGALVLKESIDRAGSVEGGLRFYVGAANLPDDGGYAGKVLAEQQRLQMVASGRPVAIPSASGTALSVPTKGEEPAGKPLNS